MTSLAGRLVLVQAVVVAVVLAAAGAVGTRDSVADQIVWVNVAVVAAIASGLANGLWIVRARRAFAHRRRSLLGVLDSCAAPEGGEAETTLVSLPGLTLFHRSTCPLVAGKAVVASPREQHDRAGRSPCGWCEP